jgi:outer membrane protein assembly factor BamB
MTRFAALTIALLALLAAPARGDGGGKVAGGDAGALGVTGRGLAVRYLTQQAPGGTLVLAVQRNEGSIVTSRFLREPLVVSSVAYDGSATGLSADGRTLVLARPHYAFPVRRSVFVVLDTGNLRRVGRFSLRGEFALDAISPDGRLAYLVQSLSATRYEVRAFNLATGRLRRAPVVDRSEPDEPLRGGPYARAMSRDGRWAYTLYDGNGTHPFIHALDTARGEAKCIDLDGLAGADFSEIRLGVGGDGTVVVRDLSRALYAVDPHTFAVTQPRAAAPARPAPKQASDGGLGWAGPVAGLALVALLAAFALRLAPRPRMR